MFSYVKLILLKIQNSLMLGTVYGSSIVYIKIKVATRERAHFLNPLFCLIHANYPSCFVSVLILKPCSIKFPLRILNNNDTGNKIIINSFIDYMGGWLFKFRDVLCVPVCSISFEKFVRAKWLQRYFDGIPLRFILWSDNLIRLRQLDPHFSKQPNPFFALILLQSSLWKFDRRF